ncbi:MAG: hypothetical protein ABIO43_08340 [Sphingomicrobium sp.]
MLADRERAAQTHDLALRRELTRRIVDSTKQKFVTAFVRQQRFYRVRTSANLPPLPIETLAVCEAVELAADPGWDAERAWKYSESRQLAVDAVDAEFERRQALSGQGRPSRG